MKKTVFLCVGGDSRQTYMSSALSAYGKVYIFGIKASKKDVIDLDKLELMDDKADILVLPIMKEDSLDVILSDGKKVHCSELPAHLKKNAIVTGGRLSTAQIEYFSALGFDVTDYFKREELVLKNCVPTAEGALQISMQELGTTVFGINVLVIGYGRVGKAVARLFKNVGSNVTVADRKLSSIATAEINEINGIALKEVYGSISKYDLIINTVPTLIITKEMMKAISKDTLIIDLASKPGGVDLNAAEELNKKVIWALSLPGKYAPITSGEIIADAVRNIILERGIKNAT